MGKVITNNLAMQNEGARLAVASSHISNFQVHPDLPLPLWPSLIETRCVVSGRLGQLLQHFLEFRQFADFRYDTLQ